MRSEAHLFGLALQNKRGLMSVFETRYAVIDGVPVQEILESHERGEVSGYTIPGKDGEFRVLTVSNFFGVVDHLSEHPDIHPHSLPLRDGVTIISKARYEVFLEERLQSLRKDEEARLAAEIEEKRVKDQQKADVLRHLGLSQEQIELLKGIIS